MQQTLGIAVVAAGGALGSVVRYVVSLIFAERFGTELPYGTFVINVSGAFLIGIVLQLASRSGMSPYLRLFLATGILGGYTTFSTYAFEIYTLGVRAVPAAAMGYALGSVVLGVAAAWAGVAVTRALVN